jgi:acyl-CoA synthetase (AMP-forming)/AMP-acid ligase II
MNLDHRSAVGAGKQPYAPGIVNTAAGFPSLPASAKERTVPELLQAAVDEAPDRRALVAHSLLQEGETTLSYSELADRSSRLATVLAERGVKSGDRVAIVVGNDGAVEAHTTYHAVHRLGAINVPINTFYVEREFEFALNFIDPAAVVFAPAYAGGVRAARSPAVLLEASDRPEVGEPLGSLLESAERHRTAVTVSEDADADWIFTSGTTGHPKAVALTHAGSVACAHEASALWGLDAHSVYQNSSPFFTSTGAHTNLLSCLAARCTYVVDPEVDAQAIVERAARNGTTTLFVLTAILAILFRRLDDGRLRSLEISSLKRLFYGGQTMPRSFHDRLVAQFAERSGVGLGVVYGLTEGGTSGLMLDPEDHAEAVQRHGQYGLSIGRRPWNDWIEHRVVGPDGEDIAPGEVGEIWLRAPSVMSRYVGNEEDTVKALAGGWLHTGDMATIDDGGFIYFVDRSKSMIRRGGMNIAAAEVEAVALGHPAVADAAAIGRPNPVLGEDVHLIVVAESDLEVSAEELIEFLRGQLADYKVPRSVSFTEALPRNAIGKVARAELPALLPG